jgi:23S rRNA (cytidine1920-2'-O)/16S rRNA (cytidine1409-2'-O)-methyltransferase
LDKLLVAFGLAASRERAKDLILQKAVLVDGVVIDKPGRLCHAEALISLLKEDITWVSRGALKLIAAIEDFEIQVHDKICLDIGASTGGFTEVLLSHGASKVYAVDVGQGQLVDKIRNDKRVENLEKIHVKDQILKNLFPKPELCVIDVSFISLEKVIPYLPNILNENAKVVLLVKPQFEVGKSNLNRKGIVKNEKLFDQILKNVQSSALNAGFETMGTIGSPILGGDGNKEFLMCLNRVLRPSLSDSAI